MNNLILIEALSIDHFPDGPYHGLPKWAIVMDEPGRRYLLAYGGFPIGVWREALGAGIAAVITSDGREVALEDVYVRDDGMCEVDPIGVSTAAPSGFVHLHSHSEYCLAPETLVCTIDMVWKKIGDVVPGEVLVGFDEDLRPAPGQRGNSQSKMRPTTVIAAKRRVRDCYRITLEDGTSIISSAKHGWVVTGTTRGSLVEPDGPECGYGMNTRRWLTTERIAQRPERLPKLVRWTSPWGEVPFSLQREAAYLGGILDGEGWLHNGQLQVAQNPGPVLDEIKRCCDVLGYSITPDRVQSGRGECRMFRFAGYETALRVLSQCDPVRFRDRWGEVWEGRRAGGRYTRPVQIVAVEHLGEMETVALTTSTKTFVAEGFLSHNSPLDGLATIEEMVDAAIADGQQALALTDHGVCSGHVQLQSVCQKKGIKPIFGIESYLVNDRRIKTPESRDYWHLVMLAQTEEGLRNLWAASTEAELDGFYYRPRMDWDVLERHNSGIIVSTACLRGPLSDFIVAGDDTGAKQMLARMQGIFGDRLYLELHTNQLESQRKVNEGLVSLAQELSVPTIVVADSHYACMDDHQAHKVWIAAQTDRTLQDEQDLFSGDEHYHISTVDEVAKAISYLPERFVTESIANTAAVAAMCDATIKAKATTPVYHRKLATTEDAGHARDAEEVRKICETAWEAKVGWRDGQDVYRSRFEEEMAQLTSKRFCGYLLIVYDYCLSPSTPVLTEDLRWVEIGKLEVGDRIAGFDQDCDPHRYWRSAEVLSSERVVLPSYKVVLSDGTETIASEDHQWLVSSPSGSFTRWVKSSDLRVGQRAQRLVNEWTSLNDWDAGYVAGILDGEGSLSFSENQNGGRSTHLTFAQREGEVLRTALRILDSWGFEYSVRDHGPERNGLKSVRINGGRSEVMRILGMCRPQRLLAKHDVGSLGRLWAIDRPSIVSVEPVGDREVVALKTTTGTLVAQGIAHHNCNAAHTKKILMGPGRGSAAGSLVCFLMGITGIDPIEARLLFERFISPGRTSLPDIDSDFPSSKRDEMTQYIIDRWGADHVVQVGTEIRLKNKSVIRDVARVFKGSQHEVPFKDLEAISKILTEAESDTAGLGLSWEELWAQEEDRLGPWRDMYPEVFKYAEKLVGRLKGYGKHPAGLVIDPMESLVDRWPLRQGERAPVASWPMATLDALGLVKFDILTLRTLDTLQETIELIREDDLCKIDIDPYLWREEYDDPDVWEMLCEGDTIGVFQIETPSGTRLTQRFQPRSIDDLCAILTLVRPGPMRSGLTESFIARRAGTEAVEYPHPLLEEVLAPTFGTMIYQEDIMAVCKVLAGYSSEDADEVRSILGKKKVDKIVVEGERFVARCFERGIDRDLASHLWEQMAEFARYSFNRSHSWSYALLAYWCAWLKCHYPTHFFVALLSTVKKERIPEFVNAARNHGFSVLLPDVNESQAGFSVSPTNRRAIRYGLSSLMGLGDAATAAVLSARPYSSWDDFVARRGDKCNWGHIRILAYIGALDSLVPNGFSRVDLEAVLEDMAAGNTAACRWQTDKYTKSVELCGYDWTEEPVGIGKSGKPLKAKPKPKGCTRACRRYEEVSSIEWVVRPPLMPKDFRAREREVLGVYVSSTPFDILDMASLPEGYISAKDFENLKSDGVYYVVGEVAGVKKTVDKHRRTMAWVTLTLVDGAMEFPVFSSSWDKYHRDFALGQFGQYAVKVGERGCVFNNHFVPIQ